MDSSKNTSLMTVTIKDPVAFILGREKIKIHLRTLSATQLADLLVQYIKECQPFIRSGGVSLQDIADSIENASPDFSLLYPTAEVTPKTRVLRLSAAWISAVPNLEKPNHPDADGWLTHALYVTEYGTFLLGNLAIREHDQRSVEFLFVMQNHADIVGHFELRSEMAFVCLHAFDVFWNACVARQETRLSTSHSSRKEYKGMLERLDVMLPS